jgi:hypothetical protein
MPPTFYIPVLWVLPGPYRRPQRPRRPRPRPHRVQRPRLRPDRRLRHDPRAAAGRRWLLIGRWPCTCPEDQQPAGHHHHHHQHHRSDDAGRARRVPRSVHVPRRVRRVIPRPRPHPAQGPRPA